jgi:hypothetical protein
MAKKKPSRSKQSLSPLYGQNRTILKLSLLLKLALIPVVLMVMQPAFFSLSLSHVTKDPLLSEQETVFVTAERSMFDIDLRWSLLAVLVAGTLYSLLLLTRWAPSYQKAQTGRIYLWRWAYFALAGSLLFKAAAMVSGVEDLFAIKMAAGLIVVAAGFAWLSERQNEKSASPVWSGFVLALVSGFTAWTVVAGSLIGTALYGMVRLPWYVYALAGILVLGQVLVAVNLYLSHKRRGASKDYVAVERNYLLVSLLTQLAFIVTAVLAFRG